MLMIAKIHIERGGKPVKKMKISEKVPLRMTCQPMAIYFSSELFNRKFHKACMDAERKSKTMAKTGMGYLKNGDATKRPAFHFQNRRSLVANLCYSYELAAHSIYYNGILEP